MPPFAWLARFGADFDRLTPAQPATFLAAVAQFVEDLRADGPFRKGLRVKSVQGAAGMFDMTWADDGRATFQYADAVLDGEPSGAGSEPTTSSGSADGRTTTVRPRSRFEGTDVSSGGDRVCTA